MRITALAPLAGLEPTTCGLEVRDGDAAQTRTTTLSCASCRGNRNPPRLYRRASAVLCFLLPGAATAVLSGPVPCPTGDRCCPIIIDLSCSQEKGSALDGQKASLWIVLLPSREMIKPSLNPPGRHFPGTPGNHFKPTSPQGHAAFGMCPSTEH